MGFCAAVGVGHQRFVIPEFQLQGDGKCGISICGKHCKWRSNGIRKNVVIVRVRAEAYKRIPMETETSGAYQLIDDQTGQKFIVWGGGDDDDSDHSSSLPSQQVLSWNPKPRQGESH